MPKVSVAMPVYNDALYVREAVESILGQSFHDFELIIVDDGSTDNTARIIESYTDRRIRIIRFAHNRGRPFARNAALEAAQGQYLAWMDADDISLPHRLERQISFLDAHPKIAVCGSAMQCFHEHRGVVRFPQSHDTISAGIIWEPTIGNAVSCLRLHSLHEHGLRYREDLLRVEDYGFWADLLLNTSLRAANLPDTLYLWRYFHRPTSPAYHAKVAQNVLHYLDLPDDYARACLHTILSCSSYEAMPQAAAGNVLGWADSLYKAVMAHTSIPAQPFLSTIYTKVEKFLALTAAWWPAFNFYKQLPLGKLHPSWRLLGMIALRRCYKPIKIFRQGSGIK